MNSLLLKSAVELSTLLEKKEITATEIANAFLEQIKKENEQIGAFVSYDEIDFLKQAAESDARRQNGKALSPLDGIPVAIKDNIAVKDAPLSCASKMLKDFISPYDATVITKLKNAGAIIFGRLNMDEFAMGSSTENSAIQKTKNPWNLNCVPGGSSGGSAAAIAAKMTPLALGTDTGGSIRQPASFCGIVGFKPTYGSISRYGAVAFASSLEQIGPMAHSVADAALLYDTITGEDIHDSTSLPGERKKAFKNLNQFENNPVSIGIPKEYLSDAIDPEIRKIIQDAADWYKSKGCTIKEISIPSFDLAIPTYYIIATAEASSNLARFDGIRYTHRSKDATDAINIYSTSRGEGFGTEVKRRILLGTYVLSAGYYDAYYLKAQKVRTIIRNDFQKAFEDIDFILMPTCPETAFPIEGRATDPITMYLGDLCTVSANLTGLPAISFPGGFSKDNMPIGLQIIGPATQDDRVFAIANIFDKEHDYKNQTPASLK